MNDDTSINLQTICDPKVLALYSCLLFLDFDGVLHNFNEGDLGLFKHRDKLERLLHDNKHVGVVFSTSWRFSHTLKQLANIFDETLINRFIGVTPESNELFPPYYIKEQRFKECTRFMEENKWTGYWVAVDDSDYLFPKNHPSVVITNPDIGLSRYDIIELSALFNVHDI